MTTLPAALTTASAATFTPELVVADGLGGNGSRTHRGERRHEQGGPRKVANAARERHREQVDAVVLAKELPSWGF